MEPELEPEQPKKPLPKGRLYFRMAMLPIAFAWLAFLICAPLAILDEKIALFALAFGGAIGVALLVVNPKWVQKVMSSDDDKRPSSRRKVREVTQRGRYVLTAFSLCLALATGYFLQSADLKERSLFTFIAVLLVIDLVRRPLRRAWGLAGSAVGLMISGALIVLLLRATSIAGESTQLELIIIASILLSVDIFEEYRALKRANAVPPASQA